MVESDGTLILNIGKLTSGTRLTVECAKEHGRPFLIVQLDGEPKPETVIQWTKINVIRVLNVAGPRKSKSPHSVYQQTLLFLGTVFEQIKKTDEL